MNPNQRNNYTEYNQDLPDNNEEPINNNVATMANNNLIDLSNRAPQAYDLSKPEKRNQTDNNKVIRTKGAKTIIIDNKGTSYQANPPTTPTKAVNYPLVARGGQMLPVVPDISIYEVPRREQNVVRGNQPNVQMFEDISSVESQSDNENDEVERNYPPLDEATMIKFQQCSYINKLIIGTLKKHLLLTVLPSNAEWFDNGPQGRCVVDDKGFNALLKSFMEIMIIGPMLMKKSSSDKSSQTKIPAVVCNKSTQIDDSIWGKIVPRVKINTRTRDKNNEPIKEQNARYSHHVEASNQSTNVYPNQQEQFYDNQQLLPQSLMNQNYVMQTPEMNKSNVQPQMMQYGMSHGSNATMQRFSMLQRTDLGNMVQMPAMNQYGTHNPRTQTSNAMMQRADGGMPVMQMPQSGIRQHDPSLTQVQLADMYRNRMQTMIQPVSYNHPNAAVEANIPPAYYHQHNSANLSNQQMLREVRRRQPVTQTVTRATTTSSGRGRHRQGYSVATNPYAPCPQWEMNAYQDQFRNN